MTISSKRAVMLPPELLITIFDRLDSDTCKHVLLCNHTFYHLGVSKFYRYINLDQARKIRLFGRTIASRRNVSREKQEGYESSRIIDGRDLACLVHGITVSLSKDEPRSTMEDLTMEGATFYNERLETISDVLARILCETKRLAGFEFVGSFTLDHEKVFRPLILAPRDLRHLSVKLGYTGFTLDQQPFCGFPMMGQVSFHLPDNAVLLANSVRSSLVSLSISGQTAQTIPWNVIELFHPISGQPIFYPRLRSLHLQGRLSLGSGFSPNKSSNLGPWLALHPNLEQFIIGDDGNSITETEIPISIPTDHTNLPRNFTHLCAPLSTLNVLLQLPQPRLKSIENTWGFWSQQTKPDWDTFFSLLSQSLEPRPLDPFPAVQERKKKVLKTLKLCPDLALLNTNWCEKIELVLAACQVEDLNVLLSPPSQKI